MRQKHVYFDTTLLQYGESQRGIPQVIFQLIRMILSTPSFSGITFITTKQIYARYLRDLGVKASSIETVVTLPFFPRDFRFHGFLCSLRYWKINKKAAFIIHPEYRTVISRKIPQLVIFHDFIFLENTSTPSFLNPVSPFKYLYKCYIRKKCRTAAEVRFPVTVSEFTKSSLLRHFPHIQPSSVTVLYNGIRFPVPCEVPVKSNPATGTVHFISVGGLDESRKNVPALVNHFSDIYGAFKFNLHLVGLCPEKNRLAYKEIAAKTGISDSVVFHGLVSNEALISLYSRCHFFLLPSLSEGFGLPMIEAMAYGCVVCAFKNTSIPEIGSDAIIIAENNDFNSWGHQIKKLLFDTDSFYRASRTAQQRARIFSEEAMFQRYRRFLLNSFQLAHHVPK